jgi:ketosteroid isomerase-like protein
MTRVGAAVITFGIAIMYELFEGEFMKTLSTLLLSTILAVSSTSAALAQEHEHPASMVAAQLGDAIAAGDVDTLRLLLTPDVLIFESGGVESSLAEYEGHHMPADMAFMKAMEREVMSRHVFNSGDSATVVTRSHVHGMYKEQDIDLISTETLVMKKMGGQWQIVHIHWSSG